MWERHCGIITIGKEHIRKNRRGERGEGTQKRCSKKWKKRGNLGRNDGAEDGSVEGSGVGDMLQRNDKKVRSKHA